MGNKIILYIDKICEWPSKAFMFFPIILTLLIIYEVIMRYIFSSPTDWVHDLSWMLYSTHFLIGLSATLLLKRHIKVDVIYLKFSQKIREIIDMVTLILIIFLCGTLVYHSVGFALDSIMVDERSYLSMSRIPVYPVKAIIPISFGLFGIQAVAQFIKMLILSDRGGQID